MFKVSHQFIFHFLFFVFSFFDFHICPKMKKSAVMIISYGHVVRDFESEAKTRYNF